MNSINKIRLTEVEIYTKNICSLNTGNEYIGVTSDVYLKCNEALNHFIVKGCCLKDEVALFLKDIRKNDGKSKEEFKVDDRYCVITVFDSKYSDEKDIAFDSSSDYPIVSCFSDKYKFVEDFFKSYIKQKNILISTNQFINKDDEDIDQFYCSMYNVYPRGEKCFSKVKRFVSKFNKK